MKIFRKKSIAQITHESQTGGLKRTLTGNNVVLLGIGAIIGTGIFVLTGQQAALNAGPAIALSFILAGIAAGFAALCYAELASMLPVSGSAYTYSYASLGEFAAWVMGWLLLLEYGTAAATVAVGWSGYVNSLLSNNLGIYIPPQFTEAYGIPVGDSIGLFNIPAFLGGMAVTMLLILGIKESAKVNSLIVAVKLFVLVAFILIGLAYINTSFFTPFVPVRALNSLGNESYGWQGVVQAASVIFFAYIGFEAVSTAAQETINPKKDLPYGIIGALIICTVLYILVSIVLTGIVPYQDLNVKEPIAVAVDAINLGWFAILVKIGAIMGLSSVMLVLVYGQTRIFYAMSRDGLIPSFFSKLHPKFQTPYINTLVVGLIVSISAGTMSLGTLSNLVSVGTLLAFSIICGTVIYLRVKNPEVDRGFKVPFFPIIPILGIGFCLYLAAQLEETFITLKWYILVGILFYFVYGYRNSHLARQAQTT